MIAPLRRLHRRACVALAVAVPALLVAAIAARPGIPINEVLPSDSQPPQVRAAKPVEWSRPDIVSSLEFTAGGATEIAIDARTLAVDPSVLVYWLEPGETSEPPMTGRLLGAVRGAGRQRLSLPADSAIRGGRLALFSLAHDEVIATATIDATGGQP